MTQDNINTDNTASDDTNIKMDGLKFNTNTHKDNNTISNENAEEMDDLQQQKDIPDTRHDSVPMQTRFDDRKASPKIRQALQQQDALGWLTRGWEDAQEEWLKRTATKWKKSVRKWSGKVIQVTLDGAFGCTTTVDHLIEHYDDEIKTQWLASVSLARDTGSAGSEREGTQGNWRPLL